MEKGKDLFLPLRNLRFVDRDSVKPNNYNPNKVLEKNLALLMESIMNNGFCFPIVIRPDYTIIDGFHRWCVAGREPLRSLLGGKIPVVMVEHENESDDIAGTITFNRARGTHLLEPMENIVQKLIEDGVSVQDISKKIGMSKEEIFRLSKIDRETFLKIATSRGVQTFGKAQILRKY
jgi:ParB/RepB/Spo0J family partition protein